jgi:hypothetical protein
LISLLVSDFGRSVQCGSVPSIPVAVLGLRLTIGLIYWLE